MASAEPLTLDEIRPTFARLLNGPLALAVSGGADSIALMLLVCEWVDEPGVAEQQRLGPSPLRVLTVDHGLRPESADEAAWVARAAQRNGVPHTTLVWDAAKPATGLQAAARAARYRLINEFLEEERSGPAQAKRSLVTAHHADDQAETFLMRLARGSGLDGLSGMRERETLTFDEAVPPCTVLRPLLRVPKERLVATLRARGIPWREDPSNASEDFERVRVRQALAILRDLGAEPGRIALSAERLARARGAVMTQMASVLRDLVRWHDGLYGEVSPRLFTEYPEEYRVRTLAAVLAAYGGSAPPARLSQVEALVEQLDEDVQRRTALTLGGCALERSGGGPVRVWREVGREGLAEIALQPGTERMWDGRFAVSAARATIQPVQVRALGKQAGLDACVSRLKALFGPAIPRGAAATLPAFWIGGDLVAVPGLGIDWLPEARLAARFAGARP